MTIKKKWHKALVLMKKSGVSMDTIPLSRRDSSKDISELKNTIDKFIDLWSTGRRATVQLESLLSQQRDMIEEKLRLLDEKEILIKANHSGETAVNMSYLEDRVDVIQTDLVTINERIKDLQFSAAETNDSELLNALQELEKHEAVKLLIQYLDDYVEMKNQLDAKLEMNLYLENEVKTLKISVMRYRAIQEPSDTDDLNEYNERVEKMEIEQARYLQHTFSTQVKVKSIESPVA